ncbi:HutD/Ves family protein [Thalassotalea ganghwensis]
MYHIKQPSHFKTTPWKNGSGVTTELAINDGGQMADFDWRLSIASVKEDGAFSNFEGYHRQLFLLSGHGITLTHKAPKTGAVLSVDTLVDRFDCSVFDGGSSTTGQLIDGEIIDFNVMTKHGVAKANVTSIEAREHVTFESDSMVFIYCYQGGASIVFEQNQQQSIKLEQGALLEWRDNSLKQFSVSSAEVIVIEIKKS